MSVKVWMQWEYDMEEKACAQWEGLFQKVIEAALAEEQVELPVEVEMNVMDDPAIHELNLEYRQVDRATDVLSFPLYDLIPGEAAQDLDEEDADPESGMICLGNIILSWDHVVAQAEEYGHSVEREAAFLVIHSMLHLLGYDHMEPDEEEQMIGKQKKILESFGITRG